MLRVIRVRGLNLKLPFERLPNGFRTRFERLSNGYGLRREKKQLKVTFCRLQKSSGRLRLNAGGGNSYDDILLPISDVYMERSQMPA